MVIHFLALKKALKGDLRQVQGIEDKKGCRKLLKHDLLQPWKTI